MDLVNLIIVFGVIAAIWHVISTIMIYDNLRKRGQKVSFLFLKFMAPIYAQQYKKIILKETDHVGNLFYNWIISINTALVAFIVLVIAR